MRSVASSTGRKILIHLTRGEELIGAIEKAAADHAIGAGWIRATGTLTSIEFAHHDATSRRPGGARRIATACEASSIEGTVGTRGGERVVSLRAIVSRDGDSGLDVFGGYVRNAIVIGVDAVLESFDDVSIQTAVDPESGWPAWVIGEPRADAAQVRSPSAPKAPQGVSWADVIAGPPPEVDAYGARRPALSPADPAYVRPPIPAKKREAVEGLEDPAPAKGDWVDHKQFGLCHVDGEDEDGALVIRLPSGVRKSLRLDYLRVLPARFDGQRRIFPLEPRRK